MSSMTTARRTFPAHIEDAMEILNRDFRLMNPDTGQIVAGFVDIAADVDIEFDRAIRKGTAIRASTAFRMS